jgi:hypothetical protein
MLTGGQQGNRPGVFDITCQCRWATLSDKLLGHHALDMIQALMHIVDWCNSRLPYGRVIQFAICPVCVLQHRVSRIYRAHRHATLTFQNLNLPSYHSSLRSHFKSRHLYEGYFDCNLCGSHQASADGLVAHWRIKHGEWYSQLTHHRKARLLTIARANFQAASIEDLELARTHVLVYLDDKHIQGGQWMAICSCCLVNWGWPPAVISTALNMLQQHVPFRRAISLPENTMLLAYWALELTPRWPLQQNQQVAATERKLKTLGERLCNQGFPFGKSHPTGVSRNRIHNKRLAARRITGALLDSQE